MWRKRYHQNLDPYWTIARFNSKDKQGNPVKKGTEIFYYPACKSVYQGEAAIQASADFESMKFDEESVNHWNNRGWNQ